MSTEAVAEDGIRDADVTGVQTSALPISSRTGVPVTVPGFSSRELEAASPTAVFVAKRLASFVAMPGRALESWTTVGIESERAAASTGTLTYPPIPTTPRAR